MVSTVLSKMGLEVGAGLPALFRRSHFNAEHTVCHRSEASAFRVNTALM